MKTYKVVLLTVAAAVFSLIGLSNTSGSLLSADSAQAKKQTLIGTYELSVGGTIRDKKSVIVGLYGNKYKKKWKLTKIKYATKQCKRITIKSKLSVGLSPIKIKLRKTIISTSTYQDGSWHTKKIRGKATWIYYA